MTVFKHEPGHRGAARGDCHGPGVTFLLDLAYRPFAKNRFRLIGRCEDRTCLLHPGEAGIGTIGR